MGRLMLFAVLLFSVGFAQDLTELIGSYFNREGYVIRVEGKEAYIDMGKDKVRVGEVFRVLREGKEVVNPITGKVVGKERVEVGLLKVQRVQEGFSLGVLEQGSARVGDRVKLEAKDVCFDGSEEWFFKLSSLIEGLKKGKNCTYTLRELKDGIGVEFKGSPVAFFSFPQAPMLAEKRVSAEDLTLLAKPKFIKALGGLPVGADLCDLTGTGKEFLAVLYSNKLEVYELLKSDLVKKYEYSLPAGVGVGVQCAKVSSSQDYLLINMVSGDSASSLILKPVGESLVPVARNVPYFMAVLDKSRPKETFVGQRFNFRDYFGQTVRLSFEGDNLRETGAFLAPRGFRIDSAFYYGDYLVFTDSLGRVRVFKEGSEVYSSEEGFGGSYNFVEIPLVQGKLNYIFNPRGASFKFLDFNLAFVIRNHTGVVQRFLDIVKYSRGELYLLGEKRKDLIFLKQIRGGQLEESIQAVLATKEGRIIVITGRTGTLNVQNRGDVYEIELRVL